MLKRIWSRSDHPGLIIGIRHTYESDIVGTCPKCSVLTTRVIDWLGSLMWDCQCCGNSWKYNEEPKRRQQMAIVVKVKEYQRTLRNDEVEVKVEVVKVEALRRDELPDRYIKQFYNVFRDTYETGRWKKKVDALFTFDSESNDEVFVLRVGEMYPLEEFQKRMRFIRKSGRKLRKVNATLVLHKKEKEEKNKATIKQKMFRV